LKRPDGQVIQTAAKIMTLGGMVMLTVTGKQFLTSLRGELRSGHGTSDEALISAIAAGDRDAMHVLYVRHSVRVYRFVLRLANESSLAEDLVSEVFIDVWRGARGFKAKSQVFTWLLAIARNKALSAMRARLDEQLDDEMATAIADAADDAETTAGVRQELAAEVMMTRNEYLALRRRYEPESIRLVIIAE
jgi:RNA polymerase sigma factor (sigma-70 family)